MALLMEQDRWWKRAACIGVDPDVFFPGPTDDLEIALAIAICMQCTVREPCLAEALIMGDKDCVRGGKWIGGSMTRIRRTRKVKCTRCDSVELLLWNGHIECAECGFSWEG